MWRRRTSRICSRWVDVDIDQLLADIRDAISGTDLTRVAELFQSMDEWFCNSGYFPLEWVIGVEKGRHAK